MARTHALPVAIAAFAVTLTTAAAAQGYPNQTGAASVVGSIVNANPWLWRAIGKEGSQHRRNSLL